MKLRGSILITPCQNRIDCFLVNHRIISSVHYTAGIPKEGLKTMS